MIPKNGNRFSDKIMRQAYAFCGAIRSVAVR